MTEEQLLSTENYTWPHNEAISDHKIDAAKLPAEIKGKLKAWKMQAGKYNSGMTEGKFNALCKLSEEIGGLIDEFAENGPKKPEDVQSEAVQPEKPAENKEPVQDTNNQPDAPAIPGIVNAPSKSDLQLKINAILTKDGRIYHADLKQIMGERNLNDRVEVEGIALERHWAFYYPA